MAVDPTLPDNLHPRAPHGPQPLADLVARAGNPKPKYEPIVTGIVPSRRPGWLTVTISLAPGANVTMQLAEARNTPEAIAAMLLCAPALYAPVGLRGKFYGAKGSNA